MTQSQANHIRHECPKTVRKKSPVEHLQAKIGAYADELREWQRNSGEGECYNLSAIIDKLQQLSHP
jgi:hypothetical protein